MNSKSFGKVGSSLMAALLAFAFIPGIFTMPGNQASDRQALVNKLKSIAAEAQQYYKTKGNFSFVGFALSASDTRDADGSYTIFNGGSPPMGASYHAGSMTAADQTSAQTLYIIGCGRNVGKDGINPTEVYITVTPAGSSSTTVN